MIRKKLDVFSLIKPEIEVLKKSGSETASLDCRLLLSHVLEKKNTVYTHENVYITDNEIKKFKVLISERSLGKPVSRIINKRNFWKRDFKLNEEVLDPRQDTEVLITAVLKYYTNIFDKLDILDLGSGSGCIGLSLLEELKFKGYVTKSTVLIFLSTETNESLVDKAPPSISSSSRTEAVPELYTMIFSSSLETTECVCEPRQV